MKFFIQQNSLQGKRHNNQDRMGYIYTKEALLMVVCDGLGGHSHGELAASWTVETLAQRFQQYAKPKLQDPIAFLEATITVAHSRIYALSKANKLDDTPRTTVVACVVQDGLAYWAHCGDSRLYIFRDGHIQTRTKDHSKVQHLLDTGRIRTTEEFLNHPERNRLINCLGAEVNPLVEIGGPLAVQQNDRFLLCSDGVWGTLPEAEMTLFMLRDDMNKALPALIDAAHKAGGPSADDATGIALQWLDKASRFGIDSSEIQNNTIASTIHITISPDVPEARPVSDEEIDRNIDEINAAIAKMQGLSMRKP